MIEISRLNDYFLRYIFGLKGHENILLNFANSVMEDSGFDTFETVEILNPFNLKESIESKESILDVKAITHDNTMVIVEIQIIKNQSFVNRTLYYTAKNYSSRLKEGEKYDKLSPVISINIIDFLLTQTDKYQNEKIEKFIVAT